ncbi:MAG: hypothetical protein ACYTFW_06615 [Planctomycetota bacterium]
MVAEKVCTGCKELKPLNAFYRNKGTHDGYTSECKICRLARTKRYQATEQGQATTQAYNKSEAGRINQRKAAAKHRKTEKRRISNRRNDIKRSGTEQRKASHNEASIRYRKRHPHKVKAQSAVNVAVKKGVLPHVKTLKCTDCGNPAQQYDHWQGYDNHNWLNVQPVCIKCHSLRHRPS